MKTAIIEGFDDIFLYSTKLVISLSILIYYFLGHFLSKYGLEVNYFYFGMLGQFITIMLQAKDKIERTNNIKITLVAFVISIIEFLLGGIIAMLFVSFLASFPQLQLFPMTAIAILTGAMYEFVWKNIKAKFRTALNSSESETIAKGGENNSSSGGL